MEAENGKKELGWVIYTWNPYTTSVNIAYCKHVPKKDGDRGMGGANGGRERGETRDSGVSSPCANLPQECEHDVLHTSLIKGNNKTRKSGVCCWTLKKILIYYAIVTRVHTMASFLKDNKNGNLRCVNHKILESSRTLVCIMTLCCKATKRLDVLCHYPMTLPSQPLKQWSQEPWLTRTLSALWQLATEGPFAPCWKAHTDSHKVTTTCFAGIRNTPAC